ncbi:MAG TPA: hydrogenase expression/formation protein HypE [Candidatus Aerophobetes bacterium]|uniref:Hydrogenase expression/formation protein HypE n=1 Tax=Aerophobetes bacterium TaxID=2030807 RepID=A0A7V5HYX2_UNCAE|nr:hydrogenase expression/formation protein HypE [Candidatus Aerophobetes bacterium]
MIALDAKEKKLEQVIRLAHGNGGKLTQELIRGILLPRFNNSFLAPLNDSAVFEVGDTKIAFTTDSYVIKPIFFPGGDIGKLSVSGTVNDLTVMGAKPLFISCSLIIEEGFPLSTLKKIVSSIEDTAEKAEVKVVTGDTKVVEKGSGDEIFINTSGIGIVSPEIEHLSSDRIEIGDLIVINGTVGDHSIAVLSQREELGCGGSVVSDCAPLYGLLEEIRLYWRYIKFMRDPTRGGIAGVLNEIVQGKKFGIKLWEKKIPLKEETLAFCELLGMDPLYLANEGKIVFFVKREKADEIVSALCGHSLGEKASIIGEVVADPPGKVYLETIIGTKRVVDMLVEDQLPRIC